MIAIWIIAVAMFISFGVIVFRGAPYVPTHRRAIERAFHELYPLSAKDILIDVGSGDGVVLRTAARCGARAIGYELNPFLVAISRWLSRRDERVEVRLKDMWTAPLPDDTTVVYAFVVSRDLPRLTRLLERHVERTGRPVAFIGYASALTGREPDAVVGAHALYRITPLHRQ